MKKPRKKQSSTMGPMKMKGSMMGNGKKKTAGHAMGGLFGATAKKPETDNRPPTRAQTRSARIARLSGKLI